MVGESVTLFEENTFFYLSLRYLLLCIFENSIINNNEIG